MLALVAGMWCFRESLHPVLHKTNLALIHLFVSPSSAALCHWRHNQWKITIKQTRQDGRSSIFHIFYIHNIHFPHVVNWTVIHWFIYSLSPPIILLAWSWFTSYCIHKPDLGYKMIYNIKDTKEHSTCVSAFQAAWEHVRHIKYDRVKLNP